MDKQTENQNNKEEALVNINTSLVNRIGLTPSCYGANSTPQYSTDTAVRTERTEKARWPILNYLRVIRERKWPLLAVLTIVVALSIFITQKMRPEYDAHAKVMIGKSAQKAITSKDLPESDISDREYFQTQLDLLRSRTLAKRVIDKLNLQDVPEFREALMGQQSPTTGQSKPLVVPVGQTKTGALSDEESARLIDIVLKQLTVKTTRDSRLVTILYSSYDAKLSADVANAFAKSYIDYNLESHFKSTTMASDWLQQQLGELRAKVERSQEALLKYGKENQIIPLDDNKNVTLERFAALNQQLVETEAERIKAEAIYRQSLTSPDSMPQIIQNQIVIQLLGKLSELKQVHARLSETYQPDYPEVLEVARQIEQLETQITQTKRTILENISSDYQTALRREKNLRDTVGAQRALTLDQNDRAVQYGILKREADANAHLYDTLLEKMKEAGVLQAMQTNNIQIVDEAEARPVPARPNKVKNVGLGVLLGLLLGIGTAFLFDHLDDSIKTTEEIDREMGVAALGAIPSHKLSASSTGKYRDMLYGEAYRNLRTSVMLCNASNPPQTILVTSCFPGEGKSTVTTGIASTLAKTGAKVLIIDGDLRHPTCHSLLNMSNEVGLSNLLFRQQEKAQFINGNSQLGIDLLAAGPSPFNPSELLSNTKMRESIEVLRDYYDFILIDSPPVMGFPDPIILSQYVDGVILVVRAGHTPRHLLRQVKQRLLRASANVMGVVLNRVDIKKQYPYYGKYFNNYYSRYYRQEKNGQNALKA
ncbi:MAG: polysaccharide biosynthesis tyrosine autokinase [Acidobacteriota bacterium]